MSGQTLRVIPRQMFDFSYLAANTSETRVLVGKIPTSQWTQGALLVRVHNKTFGTSSGGSLEVEVVLDAADPADPGHTFVGTSAITGGQVAIIDGQSPAAGEFSLSAITGDLGSMVAVQVVGNQDTTSQLALALEISADLILKAS